jgi:16S rRNA (cytidine1402-2'-O)-methyltransferase
MSDVELGPFIQIRQWYNKRTSPRFSPTMPGTLFVVATPIGNLEDITARALRVLREVRLIAAEDTRRTARLLARYAIDTPTTSFHKHTESSKLTAILERLNSGDDVALVSDAGTPTVSDPGQHLIRAAIEAGLRVEPIPGPSAVLAALAASGIEAPTFVFMGFPPTRSKDRKTWLDELRNVRGPAVFFEAPHRIRETLEGIRREIGDCSISLARELTKVHEEFVRGPISSVLEHLTAPIGEYTVVIDIGHTTDNVAAEPVSPTILRAEFGQMTSIGGLTRRKALGRLARTHGIPVNMVYDLIEGAKKSID